MPPYPLRIITDMGIAVVLAMSLNVVLGYTGQFSLGHAGFMAIGAYVSAAITVYFPQATVFINETVTDTGIFILATLVGALAAALGGLLVGLPTLRLRGDYLAIATLGFGEIVRVVLLNVDSVGGARGFAGIPHRASIFWVFGSVALCAWVIRALMDSAHGRAWLAVRENEVAAASVGIDTVKYKTRAFVLSSFFAGVAGAMFAHHQSYLNPQSFQFQKSIEIVVMVGGGRVGEHARCGRRGDSADRAAGGVATAARNHRRRFAHGHLFRAPRHHDVSETAGLVCRIASAEKSAMSVVLQARDVGMQFGGLKALQNISFTLNDGELVSLIGPNGAGKTTFFNVLTGVYTPTEGSITLAGQSIVGLGPHTIAARGLTRTFQNIRLFKKLSVRDNVRIGAHGRADYGMWAAGLKLPHERETERQITELADHLLEQLGLGSRADEMAGSLPYGPQRRLEIARALATGARTLLLDEPEAGINERETESLMGDLLDIRKKFSLTLLLIEHDMRLVMGLSERIIVLDHGQIIAEGLPAEVRENPAVLAAYLGTEPASAHPRKPVSAPKPAILSVRGAEVRYGPIQALKGVDLEVREEELVTLIGANGAGKSTLLKAISGMVPLTAGVIEFNGRKVSGLAPNQLVRLGIAHSPEGRRIFADLTVDENLQLGAYPREEDTATDREHVLGLFPRLRERLWQRAGTLSGGEQQMLAMARALMAKPKLLLLDEPSLGLAPQLVAQIFHIIENINAEGISVLLVEQNANQALATATRGYVLETGKVTLSGQADMLLNDPAVRAAYLG